MTGAWTGGVMTCTDWATAAPAPVPPMRAETTTATALRSSDIGDLRRLSLWVLNDVAALWLWLPSFNKSAEVDGDHIGLTSRFAGQVWLHD
jgi:hypothetical protein